MDTIEPNKWITLLLWIGSISLLFEITRMLANTHVFEQHPFLVALPILLLLAIQAALLARYRASFVVLLYASISGLCIGLMFAFLINLLLIPVSGYVPLSTNVFASFCIGAGIGGMQFRVAHFTRYQIVIWTCTQGVVFTLLPVLWSSSWIQFIGTWAPLFASLSLNNSAVVSMINGVLYNSLTGVIFVWLLYGRRFRGATLR